MPNAKVRRVPYYYPSVRCPFCKEAGRATIYPKMTSSPGKTKYFKCKHPACGQKFAGVEKDPES